ncbi:MAG: protoporphyrinogen/coproporphyrinogen oxidase, partial [Verrucomicrobiota bacterium]
AVIRRSADGAEEPVVCDKVIVTTPPWKWKDGPFDAPLAERLSPWSRCEAPPVTVVARGYDLGRIRHPLDGFGYLTPGEEGRRVLGCLFPSSVIPGRAPEGKALLCCFLGGARQPAVARRDDDELRGVVDRELSETLGASGPPEREWIQRWEQAIPQYDHDQRRREACLAALEREEPGIRFHGAFRGGISLMHAVRGGDALGRALAREH